jgi:hypothetical protein
MTRGAEQGVTYAEQGVGYSSDRLPPTVVHGVLSSPRRAIAIRLLRREGSMSIAALADAVAAAEAGSPTPPSPLRESVYNSLRQTHVPRLADLGFVAYDPESHEVRSLAPSRSIGHYATPIAVRGVSWAELYRGVGVVGLCLVVGAHAGLPGVSIVDPLLWASAALVALALLSCWHLVADRRRLRALLETGTEQ